MREVRRLVDLHSADVVVFQEVPTPNLALFRSLFEGAWPPEPGHAGLALLRRGEWLERGELRLTSFQGRQLLWVRTKEAVFATVHLESTSKQTQARLDQLTEVFDFLERFPRVVLMGDFNFAPDWPENGSLPTDYRDAWEALHPELPGFTEDTQVNRMRLALSGKEKQVRFDRVLCKGMEPLRIELVGTEPLAVGVWPSDHFGLVCDLELGALVNKPRPQRLLLLGRHYSDYGCWEQQSLGAAVATISVGSDKDSPSKAFKGDKLVLNEDAVLVVKEGDRYLLAVADGHFGHQTSHALTERLSQAGVPADQERFIEALDALKEPPLLVGAGSSLVAVVVDQASGRGMFASAGDSSLGVLDSEGFRVLSDPEAGFFYFSNPPDREDWVIRDFEIPRDGALLLYTDGVNECHYRHPETSVGPEHIALLWKHVKGDVAEFAGLLTKLALSGLAGQPGGQDNIGLVVMRG